MKSVLLVEDSRFLRTMNGRALTKAGFSVMTASDGQEALLKACAEIPDLILLDMLLPKIGGPQVLRALRKNPVTAAIPVVVLSSLSQKNEARLKKDGPVAYFEKSKLDIEADSESLIAVVKKILATPSEANEVTQTPSK